MLASMRTFAVLAFVAFVTSAASCGSPLFSPRGEIQGEACDKKGKPLVGVAVVVDGAVVHTDADGHFRAKAVEPGVSSVAVEGVRRVEIAVPEHDIAVVFDDSCRASNNDAPPFAAYGA